MLNINTKEYWNLRFRNGDWEKCGPQQTQEYAIANVSNISIDSDFNGKVLDFGCALGDAIPIYSKAYSNARLIGIDISEEAVGICENKYGDFAVFICGNHKKVPNVDVIIASHVMEHITDDRDIVSSLLTKCNDLFVFVPYKENPLYFEHVNYYEKDYYDNLNVIDKKIFSVSYKQKLGIYSILKNLLRFKFAVFNNFAKDIIMFHIVNNE